MDNLPEILGVVSLVSTAIYGIIRYTTTKKDDTFWNKYIAPILRLVGIDPSKNK